jgi:hypothetical protein
MLRNVVQIISMKSQLYLHSAKLTLIELIDQRSNLLFHSLSLYVNHGFIFLIGKIIKSESG